MEYVGPFDNEPEPVAIMDAFLEEQGYENDIVSIQKSIDTLNENFVSDKHYDRKYNDMQERLDKLYNEMESIETLIEEVETRLYNIRQEKISSQGRWKDFKK